MSSQFTEKGYKKEFVNLLKYSHQMTKGKLKQNPGCLGFAYYVAKFEKISKNKQS